MADVPMTEIRMSFTDTKTNRELRTTRIVPTETLKWDAQATLDDMLRKAKL